MRGELARDRLGEQVAVDCERRAGGDATRLGRPHHERPEPPHFFFQETDCVIELVAAKGVAADELGEPIRLVDGGGSDRPHLVQPDPHASRGRLPGSLRSGEAAADDG